MHRVTTDRIPYDLAELIARNPDQYVFRPQPRTRSRRRPVRGLLAKTVTLGDGSTATFDGTNWVAASAAPAKKVYVGATEVTGIYVGADPVVAVYQGATQIYP